MNVPSFRIRRAEAADATAIAETYLSAKRLSLPELLIDRDYDLAFQVQRWTSYIVDGSRAQFAKGDGWVFLAEAEGAVVGYVAWHSTSRHGVEAELQSLYVLKEFQNIGVGSTLLIHAAGDVLDHDLRSMCVGFDPANPYKQFYFKHGALPLGEHWAVWRDVSAIVPTDSLGPKFANG